MSSKKNVFLVLTEYQFLQALNISTGVYKAFIYTNVIYLIRNGKRLKSIDSNKNWIMDNIQIRILDNEKPITIVDRILCEKPNHFYFFQANSPLNVQLAYTLAKRGVEISLGPDGYNAYAIFDKKHHFLSVIKDSYFGNRYLLKHKLFNGKIHCFDFYKYGNHRFINNLWITHPEQFVRQAKSIVKILKLPDFNGKCIEFIKNCFNFVNVFPTEDVIYFFNQPLWPSIAEKEYDFLVEVLTLFPDRKVIIKLHPVTDSKMKARYMALDNTEIIESDVPAEVLLLSLKKCIVYTSWSSVLITENPSCNYYFNYPIYKKMNDPILSQINIVTLNHITLIQSPLEMKFPNE